MDKPRFRILASQINDDTFLIIPISGTNSRKVYTSHPKLGLWRSGVLSKWMYKDRL